MRIERIIDTRQYEEQGDRWVPIPGSGDARACDRCGRSHEVHAYVRDREGKHFVVGTGCMGASSAVAKSLATKASTVRRWEAQRDALRALLLARLDAEAKVDRMTPPDPVIERHPQFSDAVVLRIGDGKAWIRDHDKKDKAYLAERQNAALNGWRTNRLRELGFDLRTEPHALKGHLDDVEYKMDRAAKALRKAQDDLTTSTQ
jgi:hypothetical protein